MMNTIVYSEWLRVNGDNTLRVQYPLNKDSVVFDLGTYRGDFAEKIHNLYGSVIYCFEPIPEYYESLGKRFKHIPNIVVFPLAITALDVKKRKIFLNRDSTSMYQTTDYGIMVDCIQLKEALYSLGEGHIDLLKINIEGEEYALLDYMITTGLVKSCGNIQVQFHDFIEEYQEKYVKIATQLHLTHKLTYRYPFVWENWEKI